MKFIYKVYYIIIIYISKIKFRKNGFACDLFAFCGKINLPADKLFHILKMYQDSMDKINRFLYLKLSPEDRNIFIRFFLKRFFGIDTATKEEIEIIDEAFTKVESLYMEHGGADGVVEFSFRGRELKYYSSERARKGANEAETRLLNYYDVTQAFFLTEYEKEGFNPENGMVILDCGAAHGDTALMFNTLYPDSMIYSFEFGDVQFLDIKDNLRINNIEKVIPVQAFLYSDSKKHFLDKDYKIVDVEYTVNCKNSTIKTLSLDDYVESRGIEKIGLIKFDIEGGEQAALQGAIRIIQKNKPFLYIPIYHLNEDIYKIPEFLHMLNMKMDFSLKWTEKKVWGVDCVLFVRFI